MTAETLGMSAFDRIVKNEEIRLISEREELRLLSEMQLLPSERKGNYRDSRAILTVHDIALNAVVVTAFRKEELRLISETKNSGFFRKDG
ncbi:hypothetical protein CEXT_604691 [Caerostris extrusa]|uniref:DUF4258 domain-containing protein n=1 Tax=Caerostris extrusa TaxID=172846 RepID=A0AAV4W2F9_CAEEX|nr:hypothetical protein CEXT_604691 [Caerostris extrusa]